MSEKIYDIGHHYIQFSDSDDEFGCLCIFPHEDDIEHLELDRLKSLALLGAVARLIFDGYYERHGEFIYIPNDVPEWVLDGVRRMSIVDTKETEAK